AAPRGRLRCIAGDCRALLDALGALRLRIQRLRGCLEGHGAGCVGAVVEQQEELTWQRFAIELSAANGAHDRPQRGQSAAYPRKDDYGGADTRAAVFDRTDFPGC